MLYGSVLVPTAVIDELAAGAGVGANVPDPTALEWIAVRSPSPEAISRVHPRLHLGEREALALGVELSDALLILDDGDARREAAALGLHVIGTVGVLVLAKHGGHINAVAPLLDALVALGFRLDDAVRATALRMTGE